MQHNSICSAPRLESIRARQSVLQLDARDHHATHDLGQHGSDAPKPNQKHNHAPIKNGSHQESHPIITANQGQDQPSGQ